MNDPARFYDINGVGRLPSVTTILSVIAKPGLYVWQAKQGSLKALNVMERLKEMSPFLHDSLRKEFGEAFFKDGYHQAAEAADYGKQAHAIIEKILNGTQTLDHWEANEVFRQPLPVQKAVASFLEWKVRTAFEVIKTESVIWSKKFGYAGTCDAIGRTKDGVTLLDWKTSKRIYPEYKMQTVAYKAAAEEMSGERIEAVMICRFGKDGSFEDYLVPKSQYPDLLDRFIDAKRLWEWQREEERLAAA